MGHDARMYLIISMVVLDRDRPILFQRRVTFHIHMVWYSLYMIYGLMLLDLSNQYWYKRTVFLDRRGLRRNRKIVHRLLRMA